MKRAFIGIDLDTRRLAWCARQEGKVVGCACVDRVNGRGEVLPMYDGAVGALFRWAAQVDAVVYVEGAYLRYQAGGQGGRGSVAVFGALERVQGEIRVHARGAGLRLFEVAPSEWQRALLGVHEGYEAMKEDSVSRALGALGPVLGREPNHHEADAFHVARFAEKFHGKRLAAMGGEQLVFAGSTEEAMSHGS